MQINGIALEDTEIDSHKYSQLPFNTVSKAILWRKDSFFNKWYWNIWVYINKTIYLTPYTKIKMIIDRI